MHITSKNTSQHGFSLIQISIIIAISGIVLSSTLPGGERGSDIEKNRITKERMERIETATQGFMTVNLRRPCPADGILTIGNANFGVEDTTNGRCSNSNFYTQSTPLTKTGATTTSTSAIATTLSNTTGLSIGMLVTGTNIATDTHISSIDSTTQITLDKYALGASGTLTFTSIAAGVVPTKTLGLPDDYMFDGYGRRIGYVVDIRATNQTTCRNIQATKTDGAIEIVDNEDDLYVTDNVMWSLISYGKNGHGAFPMQGNTIANRINSGATNNDEEINAFINTSGTFATAFTQKLVKHEPVTASGTNYFDDTVWVQESTKNTCCTGKICMIGTRIDGASNKSLGSSITVGDINGDGISDIVTSTAGETTIRVIFGSATGWTPNTGMKIGTANSSRFFTITNNSSHSNFAQSVAVGDLNGDGYDDIAISYGNGTSSNIKVFYGSAIPVDTNTSAITNIITFPVATGSTAPSIAIGNFANTNKKDILALVTTASGAGNSTAYIIYGAASYSLTAEAVTTLAASNGFKINTTTGRLENISGVGDLNNNGYDEIIISNITNTNVYVLFGQSAANWNTDKTIAATGSTPDIINIDTRVTAGGTEAIKFTNASSDSESDMSVADINGDGTYNDLIFNNGSYFNIYYGKAAASWGNVDLSVASNYNGTNGFRINMVTTVPSGVTSSIKNVAATDVNGDGKIDLIFSDNKANSNATNSGSSFIALQPDAGWSSIWTSGTIGLFSQIFNSSGLPLNNDVNNGFRIDGDAANDEAVFKNIADTNNDGKADLIIGAPIKNSAEGSIYILFGRTIVPWDTTTSLGLLN